MFRTLVICGALASIGLSSCVDGDYGKLRVYQPPIQASVDSLQPGVTTLRESLDRLGAPVLVREVGLGMALAWGWQTGLDWNIEVSVPVGDAQANFSYNDISERTRGIVLFFDEGGRLTLVREGYLRDLVPSRQLPRDVDDELRSEG